MSYTYTQLKSAIQNYVDNNETTFVSNLDRFIKVLKNVYLPA